MPVSRATVSSSAVVGPGISSANAKFAWSSAWQKYWERNSSGRQTIWAPCFAASRMRAIAFAMFAVGSVPHCIWTRATFVIPTRGWALLHRIGGNDLDALDVHPLFRPIARQRLDRRDLL